MKTDLLLIVGKSPQNRNPKGFRPRIAPAIVNLFLATVAPHEPNRIARRTSFGASSTRDIRGPTVVKLS